MLLALPLDSPLLEAVKQSDGNGVRKLLEAGADPQPVLLRAAGLGNPEIVQLLLAHGANASEIYATSELIDRDRYDETITPLTAAAQNGHLEIVEMLLAAGADPNFAGIFSKRTALLDAARMGHLAIVQSLAAAGADINAIDLYDRSTALDYAFYRRYTELAAWLSAAGVRRAPQR